MTQNDQTGGISRRTVTKAMAWAAPAVAVATVIPFAAASGPETPQPGDNCKASGTSNVNKFHFYIGQPSMIDDLIILSGGNITDLTVIDNDGGCGVTVQLVSVTGTAPNIVVTYKITAIDPTVEQPYIAITSTNTTANVPIAVSQERDGVGQKDWSFYANTPTCASIGWPKFGC